MKNITIIEFDYHPEVLRNFVELLISSDFILHVFSLEKIWEQASVKVISDNLHVYLIRKRGNVKTLIRENFDIINRSDLIVFNTLASNFKFFGAMDYRPPVLLRVHNSNTYLNFSWKNLDLKPSLFFIWKDLSYFLRRIVLQNELYHRKKFIKNRVDYFSFPEKTMAEYALQSGFVSREKVIDFIPFVYAKPLQVEEQEKGYISITIVGYVDKRKKDYNEIYGAFRSIVPGLSTKVELNFLGKPVGLQGRAILQKFRKLETENFKVNSYRSFVAFNEFNRVIDKTDFLLIPVIQYYHYTIFREIAGKTKMSGNINDVIVFGKPAIIPSFYQVEGKIEPMFSTYSNHEELVNCLKGWINQRSFQAINTSGILKSRSLAQVSGKVAHSLMSAIENYKKS